jgi:Sulfotransferase domain
MKYNVVVATHHKTGTVWMDGVFKAIAKDLGVRYLDFKAQHQDLPQALDEPFILFNSDSSFRAHADILKRDDVRVLHVIRDPRDVVISAMHYHRKSGESWLHEPVPGYDNITYQRRLKALPTRYHQYVYEMDHSTSATVREMTQWQYGHANCFEARYENLRQDTSLSYWTAIMSFLGFDDTEQKSCSHRFWENSLFGGLPRLGNKHVRSGDVAQWKNEFTLKLACAFIARFPFALQTLGYESDHKWVVNLYQPPVTNPLRLAVQRAVVNHWEPLQTFGQESFRGLKRYQT